MKILFIHGSYWPNLNAATNAALTDLAEYLASSGHDVHVLAVTTREYKEYTHEGVHIYSIPYYSAEGRIKRLKSWWNFQRYAKRVIAEQPWGDDLDVVVTMDTPRFSHYLGKRVCLRNAKTCLHVGWFMDLTVQARSDSGVGLMHPCLMALHRRELALLDAAFVLSASMGDRLKSDGVPTERIRVCPIWQPGLPLEFHEDTQTDLRKRLGWEKRLIIAYAGHMGEHHSDEEIRALIEHFARESQVGFLLVGDAPKLTAIEAWAHDNEWTHVKRIVRVPFEERSMMYATADIHMATMNSRFEGLCEPCKVYGIMEAGRPILFFGPSQALAFEHASACPSGMAQTNGHIEDACEYIQTLLDTPEKLEQERLAIRQFWEREHTKNKRCEHWKKEVEALL